MLFLSRPLGCPEKPWWMIDNLGRVMIRRLEGRVPITKSGFGRKSPKAAPRLASLRQSWGPRVLDTVKLIYKVKDDSGAPKPDISGYLVYFMLWMLPKLLYKLWTFWNRLELALKTSTKRCIDLE
jgi:hypothetical protein